MVRDMDMRREVPIRAADEGFSFVWETDAAMTSHSFRYLREAVDVLCRLFHEAWEAQRDHVNEEIDQFMDGLDDGLSKQQKDWWDKLPERHPRPIYMATRSLGVEDLAYLTN